MPAGKISVDFPNRSTSPTILAEHVGNFKFQLKSLHEPLRRSSRELSKDIGRQFDEGGGPPWEPLEESTVKRKGGDRRILIRTGKLKRRAVQYARWDINKTRAEYSLPPEVAYGFLHQTGFVHLGRFAGATIVPARPFIAFSGSQENIVARQFNVWYRERMIKAGI